MINGAAYQLLSGEPPQLPRQRLRTCLRSYCDAVIGANALLGILICTRKLRFLRFTPLTTSRDRS
jgi:hypothetical protein